MVSAEGPIESRRQFPSSTANSAVLNICEDVASDLHFRVASKTASTLLLLPCPPQQRSLIACMFPQRRQRRQTSLQTTAGGGNAVCVELLSCNACKIMSVTAARTPSAVAFIAGVDERLFDIHGGCVIGGGCEPEDNQSDESAVSHDPSLKDLFYRAVAIPFTLRERIVHKTELKVKAVISSTKRIVATTKVKVAEKKAKMASLLSLGNLKNFAADAKSKVSITNLVILATTTRVMVGKQLQQIKDAVITTGTTLYLDSTACKLAVTTKTKVVEQSQQIKDAVITTVTTPYSDFKACSFVVTTRAKIVKQSQQIKSAVIHTVKIRYCDFKAQAEKTLLPKLKKVSETPFCQKAYERTSLAAIKAASLIRAGCANVFGEEKTKGAIAWVDKNVNEKIAALKLVLADTSAVAAKAKDS